MPWYVERGTRRPADLYGDFARATPLVPFGFGLSYSNHTLSNLRLRNATVPADGTIELTLDVAAAGPAGKLVVQVEHRTAQHNAP